ncbi:MAG: phosphoglucosamine mutase [Defluviitaleaceae bacterium]|nr:phosphoglucosamine mutase [Defluviitaleaceae bacterium]
MGKLFGTDGVRDVANTKLTPELAFQLGRAGAYVLTKKTAGAPRVLLAKDSRRSGDMLEAALTAGLCSIGAQVFHAGVIPTPAVAYLVRRYNLCAGVMISASHNKMADNGIKFFNGEGFKLPDSLEEEIEALIEEINTTGDKLPRPVGEGVGMINQVKEAAKDYVSYLASTVFGLNLEGYKIALDCANGATSEVAPWIFKKLGAEVLTIHNTPDGSNINDECGSTHIESLQAFVRAEGADIGIAFDGDGDRMFALCENGHVVDGDATLAICGLDMKERGVLTQDTIVATVMSNQGFEVFCRANEINLHRADVGDRYVLEKMLADNLQLGGEQSGHVIFRRHSTTGDGILTALQLISVMSRKKSQLSELAGVVETFPQVLLNATVPNHRKAELSTNPEIQKAQKEIESAMKGEGRILVRPSGTEPVVRVMLEGRDKNKIESHAKKLVEVIQKNLS